MFMHMLLMIFQRMQFLLNNMKKWLVESNVDKLTELINCLIFDGV
jgi:hypothetical protein